MRLRRRNALRHRGKVAIRDDLYGLWMGLCGVSQEIAELDPLVAAAKVLTVNCGASRKTI